MKINKKNMKIIKGISAFLLFDFLVVIIGVALFGSLNSPPSIWEIILMGQGVIGIIAFLVLIFWALAKLLDDII